MLCPILEYGASRLDPYREIYRPLPTGGNPNAVNKYHIIKKSVYDLKPCLFNYRPIRLKIEIT
jgi:hypothetical protein